MALPNFLIIGAHKAGTSSLHQYLRQHPEIFMPVLKEARYFAFNPDNEQHLNKPRQTFPIRTRAEYELLFEDVGEERAVGEASPEYLNSSFAAARIRRTLPDVRLIASLRNPVDRVYSEYCMRIRSGNETRTLREIVDAGERWCNPECYTKKLHVYRELFDKTHLKIVLFDDLIEDPVGLCGELFEFLDVDRQFTPNVGIRHNAGGIPRFHGLNRILENAGLKKRFARYLPGTIVASLKAVRRRNLSRPPKMDQDLRNRLQNLYREDIRQLEALLERDLSHWLTQQNRD